MVVCMDDDYVRTGSMAIRTSLYVCTSTSLAKGQTASANVTQPSASTLSYLKLALCCAESVSQSHPLHTGSTTLQPTSIHDYNIL